MPPKEYVGRSVATTVIFFIQFYTQRHLRFSVGPFIPSFSGILSVFPRPERQSEEFILSVSPLVSVTFSFLFPRLHWHVLAESFSFLSTTPSTHLVNGPPQIFKEENRSVRCTLCLSPLPFDLTDYKWKDNRSRKRGFIRSFSLRSWLPCLEISPNSDEKEALFFFLSSLFSLILSFILVSFLSFPPLLHSLSPIDRNMNGAGSTTSLGSGAAGSRGFSKSRGGAVGASSSSFHQDGSTGGGGGGGAGSSSSPTSGSRAAVSSFPLPFLRHTNRAKTVASPSVVKR